jgi:hypothetical protein
LRKSFRADAPTHTHIYHCYLEVRARSACLKVDGHSRGVGFPTAPRRRMKEAPGGINLPGAFPYDLN